MWEVSWRRNRDCNILTPSSSDYSSTSSLFFWVAQPGSWGPKPSVFHWLSLQQRLELTAPNWTLPASNVNKLKQSVAPGNIIVWRPPASRERRNCTDFNLFTGQGDIFDIFDWMDLFLDWRLGRGPICYTCTHQPSLLVGLFDYIHYLQGADVSLCNSANTISSTSMNPSTNNAYEFVFTSQANSYMSYSSYLDDLWDGRHEAGQLLFCGLLLPRLFQNNTQCLCVVPSCFFSLHYVNFQKGLSYCYIDTVTA